MNWIGIISLGFFLLLLAALFCGFLTTVFIGLSILKNGSIVFGRTFIVVGISQGRLFLILPLRNIQKVPTQFWAILKVIFTPELLTSQHWKYGKTKMVSIWLMTRMVTFTLASENRSMTSSG